MRSAARRRFLVKREVLVTAGLAICLFCTGCSKNLKTFLIAAGALLVGHLIFRGGVAKGRDQAAGQAAGGAVAKGVAGDPGAKGKGAPGTTTPMLGSNGKPIAQKVPEQVEASPVSRFRGMTADGDPITGKGFGADSVKILEGMESRHTSGDDATLVRGARPTGKSTQ